VEKIKRELKDELEVPGYVLLIKPVTKDEAIAEIKRIMSNAEKRGCTKLKELNESEKVEIKKYFDFLGLKHNNLED